MIPCSSCLMKIPKLYHVVVLQTIIYNSERRRVRSNDPEEHLSLLGIPDSKGISLLSVCLSDCFLFFIIHSTIVHGQLGVNKIRSICN